MPIADERAKAVELALSQIEKQFGKGSIVRLGSREALVPISVISTGSISFDAALGVGGVCAAATAGKERAIDRSATQTRDRIRER